MRRICNFLEIDRSDVFLQEVAEKNNITAVKAAKENNQLVKHVLNMMSSDGSFIFYRKGEELSVRIVKTCCSGCGI